MVARENAEAAGIVWDRLVKAELGRKIGHRLMDSTACTGFAVGVLSAHVLLECVENLLQLAQKSFVLRQFLQPRLARKLEHPYGIVICPVPQVGIEMAEKPSCGRLPRPPEIKAHLAQRLERRGQRRRDVIGLESRHGELGRDLSRKS